VVGGYGEGVRPLGIVKDQGGELGQVQVDTSVGLV